MDRELCGELSRCLLMGLVRYGSADVRRHTKEGWRRRPSTRHMVGNLSPILRVECESSCSPASVAGLTYAGVSALSLLGRLSRKGTTSIEGKTMSSDFIDDLTRWLISRQTLMLHEDGESNMAEETPPDPTPRMFPPKFHVMGAYPAQAEAVPPLVHPSIEVSDEQMRWVGVNGRSNKVADTCYTFWVGGSLAVSILSSFGLLFSVTAKLMAFPDTKQSLSPRFQRHTALSIGQNTAHDWRLWKDAWRSSW